MAKKTKCPKCSGENLTVKYQEENTEKKSIDSKIKSEDCLLRKCGTCGYSWIDPCDDA